MKLTSLKSQEQSINMLHAISSVFLYLKYTLHSRNRQLLSFADDDEEDDESLPTKLPKGKSSHELTNDPRLSKIPAINFENLSERYISNTSYFNIFIVLLIKKMIFLKEWVRKHSIQRFNG